MSSTTAAKIVGRIERQQDETVAASRLTDLTVLAAIVFAQAAWLAAVGYGALHVF
jgi:hypothetical protein